MQTEQQWRKPARLSSQSNLLASSRFLLHLSQAPNISSQMQDCPAPTVRGGECRFNLNGPLKQYERRPWILYFWQQLYEVTEQGISADAPTNGSRVAQGSRMPAIRQKPDSMSRSSAVQNHGCRLRELRHRGGLVNSPCQTMARQFQL